MSSKKVQIEKEWGKPLAQVLRELYRGNQAEIARELKTSQATVSRWMRDCGLKTVTIIKYNNHAATH